jgi:hypothetical protein
MRVTSKSTDVEARDHSEVTYRIEDIHRLSQVLGSPGLSAWWARTRTAAAGAVRGAVPRLLKHQ